MYRSRVMCFVEWCATRGLCAIPAHADVLRVHLQWLAAKGQTWSTIKVSLAAVAALHRALGHEPPASVSLRVAVRELRRAPASHGRAQRIPLATLKRVLATCTSGQFGARDRALLLVAYFGNLNSGEATSLNGADVERSGDGYILHVPVKLLGRERTVELVEFRRHEDPELCPVLALDAWLAKRAQLRPMGSVREFPGYHDFILRFDELERMVSNPDANEAWHRMLAGVAGVYLIADGVTGDLYVGSAYGEKGILGRWMRYVRTKHGGNVKLRALLASDETRYLAFSFSILRTLPRTLTSKEVIAVESFYKKKLGTRAHGLNDN